MSASPYASRQEQVFLLHAARVIYTDVSQSRILQDHSCTTAKGTEAQPPVAFNLDREAVTMLKPPRCSEASPWGFYQWQIAQWQIAQWQIAQWQIAAT